jgi:transcriptional regulator with XRE-family HTH domain
MLLPDPHLGPALRRWRVLHRVKQAHAAELIGVAQSTISRWESGLQEMDPDQRARVEALVGARLTSAADRALARLVDRSPGGAHLICDHSHRLLALSPTRRKEFGSAADAMVGQSLWRFATEELARNEATLSSLGWHDLAAPPEIVAETGANGSKLVPIRAGRCRWTRLLLSDGAAVRLVETLI